MNVDAEPHTFTIVDAENDDYTIDHPSSCPSETESGGIGPPYQRFTCRLEAVLDGNGIDDLEEWRKLPPGQYEIVSYYEYTPGEYGGSYGAEHEIGLMFADTPEQAWTVAGVPDAWGTRKARYEWRVPRAVADHVARVVGGEPVRAA